MKTVFRIYDQTEKMIAEFTLEFFAQIALEQLCHNARFTRNKYRMSEENVSSKKWGFTKVCAKFTPFNKNKELRKIKNGSFDS